jgi:hypothetical protein
VAKLRLLFRANGRSGVEPPEKAPVAPVAPPIETQDSHPEDEDMEEATKDDAVYSFSPDQYGLFESSKVPAQGGWQSSGCFSERMVALG